MQCHASQVSAYERLAPLPASLHEALRGRQSYHRVFSTVSGGRQRERDVFDGPERLDARSPAGSRCG